MTAFFQGLCSLSESSISISENTWRHWSKVGILSRQLFLSKIKVQNVTYYRLITPKQSLSMFNYCIFVNIILDTPLEQRKCLNILQKLRGATLTGYVSLFRKMGSLDPKEAQTDDEFFEEMLASLQDGDKRAIKTV